MAQPLPPRAERELACASRPSLAAMPQAPSIKAPAPLARASLPGTAAKAFKGRGSAASGLAG